jgi:hypothetical protein
MMSSLYPAIYLWKRRRRRSSRAGDAINVILVTARHNLALRLAWLTALLPALLAAWTPAAQLEMASA